MSALTAVRDKVAPLAVLLEEARARTRLLVSTVSDDDLIRQHDPLMGPILWDLGHIAHFEELWLTRNVSGPIEFGEMPGTYNPFEHARSVRGTLQLPPRQATFEVLDNVRARVLDLLAQLDIDSGPPLVRDGYVARMVAQHEEQHQETILQTLQLKKGAPYSPPERRVLPWGARLTDPGAMVRFPGGEVPIGTDDRSAAYDNERPRHTARLAPFLIDVTPVTNGEFLAFIDDGGYQRRDLWSDEGWAWLKDEGEGASSPKYWEAAGSEWIVRTMDQSAPVDAIRPVCHVCWHEAEAYARWAGKRLPTEEEWEAAATWDPVTGEKRKWPWGDESLTLSLANLDQLGFGTAQIWAHPANVSPTGCYGMIGDVWEWTSSDFRGYPGFEAFPYREYSEVFFGPKHKVLRGGSWATRPAAIRGTFRNWDYPIRRQIFAGFRCAADD